MDYKNKLNKVIQNIPPSGIRKFFDIVTQMPDALSLGVGEPDFVTPWDIRDSAIKSLQKGETAYTSNHGMLELRQAVAEYLSYRFNLNYCPKEETLITIGASEAIDLSLRAVINNGDEIIMPEPSYVSYAPNVALVGGVAVPIKTTSDNGFKLTAQSLESAITKKTKALILPYPNNPTGAIMTKEELEQIAPIILKHNLIVITDEIYAELTYGGNHTSIAGFKDFKERTIYINGFSKAFAMTGFRIGFACAPKPIMDLMVKIHQYTIMCAPTPSQYAALAALKNGKADDYYAVRQMRDSYNERRKFLVSAFNSIGLKCFEPLGAFYVFPSVQSTGLDGEEFAQRLLAEQKVAVVPGSAFGASGKNYIRTCYACSMTNLKQAVERIDKFVKTINN